MKSNINQIIKGTIKLLGSSKFTIFIIGLFILQALWIAFSFRYSMVYDEYYHYGIADYLSHQWHPFILDQPAQLDQYGALGRTPWLLYHFMLSFPLRAVGLFTDHFATLVVSMRIINITLFSLGLFIYYRLFVLLGLNRSVINTTMLVFVLLPVVPFIGATVNYDNLIFPLAAALFYFSVKIVASRELQINYLLAYSIIGLLGMLTKSTFLPIFAATTLLTTIHILLNKKVDSKKPRQLINTRNEKIVTVALIIPFVLLGFLFVERYAINILNYHAISPSCSSQMAEERCVKSYVEARAKDMEKTKSGVPVQIPEFSTSWYSRMVKGWFITAANTDGKIGTESGQPLPVVYNVIFLLSIVAFMVICMNYRNIIGSRGLSMLLIVAVLYAFSLFYVNISEYFKYHKAVAVQGRYILPVLPVIMVAATMSINTLVRNRSVKTLFAVVVMVAMTNGGGLITHIIRSNEAWNWNNRTVRSINNTTRNALKPFIKEYWYHQGKNRIR